MCENASLSIYSLISAENVRQAGCWPISGRFVNSLQTYIRRVKSITATPLKAVMGPSLGSGLDVLGDCEERTTADAYRWDGMRRGVRPDRPMTLLQYTLAGRGAITMNGKTQAVPPEHCMVATIPSRHVYFLPADAAAWSFVWVFVTHAYVVQRLGELVSRAGPVLFAPAGGDLPEAIASLLRPSGDDALSREQKLFDLIIAAERTAQLRHGDRRQKLLAQVRQIAADTGPGRPNVDTIAATLGMSRSNFSHHFRATTGQTPAAFVRELRLERARDAVAGSDATLKSIARELGFADATHFGKVFRERFGFTPKTLRQQTRGR
jgi:AraC-like DNA-binding protein